MGRGHTAARQSAEPCAAPRQGLGTRHPGVAVHTVTKGTGVFLAVLVHRRAPQPSGFQEEPHAHGDMLLSPHAVGPL